MNEDANHVDAAPVEVDPAQYDDFAGAYEDHAATAPYNALYDRPATLDLIGNVRGARVLDAACGPGFYAEELIAGGAEVWAFDASAAMVELTRRRLGERVTAWTQSLDAPLVTIPDGSMDLVVCALAYHYVNDRRAMMAEFYRVLRDGGAAVISTHHPTDDWARLGGSYFALETVTEHWSRGWDITSWRMPLQQLCDEWVAPGFLISRIVEPRPLPEMAHAFPAVYAKLMAQPAFILTRLEKRGP